MSRSDPARTGRYGIQQFLRGKWTFTTVNCGYESLAEARRSIAGLTGYRVANRFTGRPIRDGADR